MTHMPERPHGSATDAPSAKTKVHKLPLLILLGISLAAAYALRDHLTLDTLRDHQKSLVDFRDAHYALTVVGFIAAYALVAAFSLPGATILTLTGGFLFATFPGALYNVSAATIGATCIFLAARWGLGAHLSTRLDNSTGAVQRIKQGIDRNQWSMLFLMRLVPAVPFVIANLVPAFVNVPLRRFVISTFLGIIPGTVVYTSIGAGLSEIFARNEAPNLGLLFEPYILFPILGLCALALLPLLVKRLQKDRPQ